MNKNFGHSKTLYDHGFERPNIFIITLSAWKTNEVRTQKGSILSFNSFKMVGREGIEPPKA